MKKRNIRILSLFLSALLIFTGSNLKLFAESAEKNTPIAEMNSNDTVPAGAPLLDCKSAVLMEAGTGKILFSKNGQEALPPASVTKIMTLLLIMEAIDSGRIGLDDTVTVSANAASMGGSQVYLKEGEQMRLEDLLKSVVIASANDAAVALAEYLCGNVSGFVEKMNLRAQELGMSNTQFENVTGLDDTAQNHLTCAYDIALMSRALIAHPTILKYSSIWMDTIRDGAFGLTNTNRLVRFYNGCTGLKTGSTSKAGFCVSATAERNGMSLICVIMGAETRDERNAQATSLLDWGFAEYGIYGVPGEKIPDLPVIRGYLTKCQIESQEFTCVLEKKHIGTVEKNIELPASLSAPIKQGDKIGKIVFKANGEVIGECNIIASEDVPQLTFFEIIGRVFSKMLLM